MKLYFLLLALKVKLQAGSWLQPKLKNALKGCDFTVNIRVKKSRYCRHFSFSNGRVKSGFGTVGCADTELIWENADIAFKALAKGDAAMLEALGRSWVVIKGNLENFFIFGDIAKL